MAELERLSKRKVKLLLPKCNFDVEITLDALGTNYKRILLFSGDGDFTALLKKLKKEGRWVFVLSGKKLLSARLIAHANRVMTLEQFKRHFPKVFYKKSPDEPGVKCKSIIANSKRNVKKS